MVSLRMFLVLTFLTGVVYPLFVTGIAQLLFPVQANGDPLLIGQQFESDRYFWGRPSAIDYNPLPSGGSNWGPTSMDLKKKVEERREHLLKAHQLEAGVLLPLELLFASGSGLDPHISPEAARFQIDRIARVRGVDKESLTLLIDQHIEGPKLGLFGEPYINVLKLNAALDTHKLR